MKNPFPAIFHAILKVFGFVVKSEAFKQFVHDELDYIGTVVKELESQDIPGSQKAAIAFAKIGADLIQRSKVFEAFWVKWAIETALLKVRGILA